MSVPTAITWWGSIKVKAAPTKGGNELSKINTGRSLVHNQPPLPPPSACKIHFMGVAEARNGKPRNGKFEMEKGSSTVSGSGKSAATWSDTCFYSFYFSCETKILYS